MSKTELKHRQKKTPTRWANVGKYLFITAVLSILAIVAEALIYGLVWLMARPNPPQIIAYFISVQLGIEATVLIYPLVGFIERICRKKDNGLQVVVSYGMFFVTTFLLLVNWATILNL